MALCGCGCGTPIRSDNKRGFYKPHAKAESDRVCVCGCGRRLLFENKGKYTRNHHRPTLGRDRSTKAVVRPTMRDLGWAAGFLEGEGSFGRTPNGGTVVTAVQVQRQPLEKLQSLFGGLVGQRKVKPGRQPFCGWSISGARARGVMMTLFALMSARRRAQIREALK